MTNVFGFSTEPSVGGDFIPIVKYDARAGRMSRIDRVDTGDGFASEPIDITDSFKAICDFDNLQVGWMDFPVGGAPSFILVPMGQSLPPKPPGKHKNGVRFMIKLASNCGGDKPVREIAGSSKAFLGAIEKIYTQYKTERGKYPGRLPVLTLVKVTPVVSGGGTVPKSTNYHPTFEIVGWLPRPDDLVFVPPAAPATVASLAGNGAAPVTGAQTVPPPNRMGPPQNLSDDFG